MSRQERKNRQRQLAKLIPPNWNTNELRQAIALYEGVASEGSIIADQNKEIDNLKRLLTAAQKEISVLDKIFEFEKREGRIIVQESASQPAGEIVQIYTQADMERRYGEGIMDGIVIYGRDLNGALYDLKEALSHQNRLSTGKLDDWDRSELERMKEEMISSFDRWDTFMKKVVAEGIPLDMTWHDELLQHVSDRRDVIIKYLASATPTARIDNEQAFRDNEQAFRDFCIEHDSTGTLKDIHKRLAEITLRRRGMKPSREYIARRLSPYFNESGEVLASEFAKLADRLRKAEETQATTIEEKAMLTWIDKHYPKKDADRTGKVIRLLDQALSSIKKDYREKMLSELSGDS